MAQIAGGNMPQKQITIGRIQQLIGEKEINTALAHDELLELRTRVTELEKKIEQLQKELDACRNTESSQLE